MRSSEISKADQKAQDRNEARIDRAIEAVNRGLSEKAHKILLQVLDDGRLSADSSVNVVALLRMTGDEERAERVRAGIIAATDQAVAAYPDDHRVVSHACTVYTKLEARDRILQTAVQSIKLCPEDVHGGLPLINVLLTRDEPDRLVECWEPILEAVAGDGQRFAVACLVRGLGYFGYRDHALAVLDRTFAETPGNEAEFVKLRKQLTDTKSERVSLDEAVADFDRFADHYDRNLAAIGNRGPHVIGQMIEMLGWARDGSREILDAGCGTGLCAPFLRPYARMLHGCDVSIGMLEKAKARNVFDLLTRTDIANPATYPDATFTDAVSADVLVYFGDLLPPLRNIASVIRPGGWIIFTVEDASGHDPRRGWERYSSGRFRHMPDYVHEVLPRAGFTLPKHELRTPLRYEFGMPVAGLCVAAKRFAFPF